MDVLKVKKHLMKDTDKILNVLEACKFYNIVDNGEYFRFGWDECSNSGSSTSLSKSNLFAHSFSRNISGDILTLVMEKLDIDFNTALKLIAKESGFVDDGYEIAQKKELFGGLFAKRKRGANKVYKDLETYPMEVLNAFEKVRSKLFIDDGISKLTQILFNIRYDSSTNRIAIPWIDESGNLVGVMGRYNSRGEVFNKYLPLIPFEKSRVLFGMFQNQKFIMQKRSLFIGESEKFVMQLNSMGIYNAVALGGRTISQRQSDLINSMYPKNIVLCFDEGISRAEIEKEANKLKHKNPFVSNANVMFVIDELGEIMEFGSKMSPSDLGKEGFMKLIKEKIERA